MDPHANSPTSIRLYRYLPDEAAIKTIERRSFRVSRLAELNDPFEWRFGFEGIPPETEEFIQVQMDGFLEDASKEMGIICFSGEIKDPILWSHYANVHRGIAFEVIGNIVSEANGSITFEVNGRRYENLFKVDYDKPRIVLHAQELSQLTEKRIEGFYKQKSKSWGYEREYRWVIGLLSSACEPSGGRFLWTIPPDFVTRVIIGFRSSVSEQYARRALELNGFQNIEITKARLSQTTYEIKLSDPTGSSPSCE